MEKLHRGQLSLNEGVTRKDGMTPEQYKWSREREGTNERSVGKDRGDCVSLVVIKH